MTGRASLLRRVRQLEDRAKAGQGVRVVITRHILGMNGQTVETVRRAFDLYPSGFPTVGGTGRRGQK